MKKLHLVLAVAAGMALSAGLGVASGAIPSSDGKINACQAKVGGFRYLRLLDTGESCRPGEKPLSWNQKGPAGGSLRLTMRSAVATVAPGTHSVNAACKTGEKVTGGAAFALADNPGVTILSSSVDEDLRDYEITARNATGDNQDVVVEAICALVG
jgi:hypothetical protein